MALEVGRGIEGFVAWLAIVGPVELGFGGDSLLGFARGNSAGSARLDEVSELVAVRCTELAIMLLSYSVIVRVRAWRLVFASIVCIH